MHGIYKYVVNDEIIYIGKSDRSICKRINDHAKEDRFKKYLATSKIYYFLTKNSTTTAAYELALINKYQPVLNVKDKHDDTDEIIFKEPKWMPYEELKDRFEKEKEEKKKEKKRVERIKFIQIWVNELKKDLKNWRCEIRLVNIFYDILNSHTLEKEININLQKLSEYNLPNGRSLLNGFSWMSNSDVRGHDICSIKSKKGNYIFFHAKHIKSYKYKFYIDNYISNGTYRRMLLGYKHYVEERIKPIVKQIDVLNKELKELSNE